MTKDQVPSIGRVVHFVMPNGQHRPAIVVQVWNEDVVNLQVFTDGSNDAGVVVYPNTGGYVQWQTSVHHAENEPGPHTWHWPEYVPAKET